VEETMARRSSFTSLLNAMAREAARKQRIAEAEHRRLLRAQIQAQRAAERERITQAKEAKQQYIEEQLGRAEELTAAVQDVVSELKQILQHTLKVDDTISFDSLRIKKPFGPFKPEQKWGRTKLPA
jgi:restriction system protein